MDGELEEDSTLRLLFWENGSSATVDIDNGFSKIYIEIGKIVNFAVVIEFCGETDDVIRYDKWQRKLQLLFAHVNIAPVTISKATCKTTEATAPETVITTAKNQCYHNCEVCLNFCENCERLLPKAKKSKGYMLSNVQFVLPLEACLDSVPGNCNRVELHVTLWYAEVSAPVTPDIQKDFQLHANSKVTTENKKISRQIISKTLPVLRRPTVKCRVTSAGGRHFILLKAINTSCHDVTLHDCVILPSSCHWTTCSPEEAVCEHGGENSSECELHANIVSLLKTSHLSFPMKLQAKEKLSLIYCLHIKTMDSLLKCNSTLSLAAHVTWSKATTQDSGHSIVTTYSLPRLKIRQPPFVINVSTHEDVSIGKSFNVTYTIRNQLHDFLALRLYWNPEKALHDVKKGGDSEMESLKKLCDDVVCQDPEVNLGKCSKGSIVPVTVGFRILKPGIFELGQHMKLNLRYDLLTLSDRQPPPSLSVSSESAATLSADDQLAASTDLWRDRSGSTSSARSVNVTSAAERRQSFATKSYSFGDLGPTQSADSDDVNKTKFKRIDRSSAVPPPRPPPPKHLQHKSELAVINPMNFLKKAFQVYIPECTDVDRT